ncbi:lipase [Microbispora sp. H10830]|uniref:alpha/beta hydrolase family protein n=1 Tax=Microbispora sp. H10830 TaxID=2729109 RepID=UPI002872D5D2|nr:lipase [Microbispora sp. H10830]
MWRKRVGALGAALTLITVAAVPAASAAPAAGTTAAVTTTPGISAVTGIRLSLPAPSGPLPVGTVSVRLVDRSRPDPWATGRPYRELMVSVWYPASRAQGHPVSPHLPPLVAADLDATSAPALLGVRPGQVDWAATRTHARLDAPVRPRAGGYPVVLYSPGYMVPRSLGTLAAEDLASRGYVVVTVDHTYEASAVEFPGGRLERARVRADSMDDAMKALDVRVADLRFVLDVITGRHTGLPSRLYKALDTARVAAVGFSMGGAATARLMYADHRVKAGVNLDGSLLGEVAERGLDGPFLQLAADEQDDPSWETFRKQRRGWKRDLRLAGAKHYSFSDLQALVPRISDRLGTPSEIVGTIGPVRSIAAQRAYVAAFLDLRLKGRKTRLFDGPSRAFPEVSFLG